MNELLQVLVSNEYLDINSKMKLGYNPRAFSLYIRIGKDKTKVLTLTLDQVEQILNTSVGSKALETAYEKIMAEEETYLEFGDQLIEQLETLNLKNKNLIERVIAYISLAKSIYLNQVVKVSLELIEKKVTLKLEADDKTYIYPGNELKDMFEIMDVYVKPAEERINASEEILTKTIKRGLAIDSYPTITEPLDDIREIVDKLEKNEKRI